MTGDLKIGGKNILNVRALSDHKEDDPLETRERDLYSVVNKQYLNTKFLKKDSNDNDFDLRGDVIRNCEPYYDGLFEDNDLVSKAFVDSEIGKLPKSETDVLKLDGSSAMSENLNMGDHAISGVKSSSDDNSVITVGGAKATYLPLIGDRAMQGDLNMGGKPIINMKPFVEDDSSQETLDAQNNYAINFGYFHQQGGDLKSLINNVAAEALDLKGEKAMQCDLKMNKNDIKDIKNLEVNGNITAGGTLIVSGQSSFNSAMNISGNLDLVEYKLIRLGDSTKNTDAVNKGQLVKAVSDSESTTRASIETKIEELEKASIRAAQSENVFLRVMDNDLFKEDDDGISKVGSIDKDYHTIKHKTYLFYTDYDSSIGHYSTRLSIDLVYLPIGYYTMASELYFLDKIDWNTASIDLKNRVIVVRN